MDSWVRIAGKRNGLVIVIKSSNGRIHRKRPTVVYSCERGGRFREKKKSTDVISKKRRQCGTKKCECPFSLRGKLNREGTGWELKVENGVHNHSAAASLVGHTYAGRLNEEEKRILVEMSRSLVRPKNILSTIKKRDERNASTLTHIYNGRYRMRISNMAGRTQMQYLMAKLAEHKYIERHRSTGGENDELIDLLWTHPTSIELLRTFPHVLIMDATYKTNRYRLPLFEIVGETSTGMTFMVAFAYLNSERHDNYHWVLGNLKRIMYDSHDIQPPKVVVTDREEALMKAIGDVWSDKVSKNLLCRWHISTNITKQCKGQFHSAEEWEEFIQDWGLLVQAPTQAKYYDLLTKFETRFSYYPGAIEYVHSSWLDPYKTIFVDCWTNAYMTLGNNTSNRAESQHAKLKRQLQSSQCNFSTCFDHIHALLEAQHDEIRASFEKSMNVIFHKYRGEEFNELRGFVSIYALDLVRNGCIHADRVSHIDETKCACSVRRTHGLPCGHEIARYRKEGKPIPLTCIHQHWRKLSTDIQTSKVDVSCKLDVEKFERRFDESNSSTQIHMLRQLREISNPATTSLLEPQVKTNNKGRPPKGKGVDKSTKRDPSGFEYASLGQTCPSPVPYEVFVDEGSGRGRGRGRGKECNSNKVHLTRSCEHLVTAFPTKLQPFIDKIQDVEGDGNCGFRVIASQMGFGEDGWLKVRKDLLDELLKHPSHYARLFKIEGKVDDVVRQLEYYLPCPSPQYWFTLPEMGYLVASCYNVVLFSFSHFLSLTFLPIRTPLLKGAKRKEMAIGFVNGSHFVSLLLHPNHPVPKVPTLWYEEAAPVASSWLVPFEQRFIDFQDKSPTTGTIDLTKD